ncbi:MAG: hypothetical protein QM737_10965 [Ferruginibacter sp.]
MAVSKESTNKNKHSKSSPKKKVVKKPSKYDEKVVVNATFEELIKELVTPKKD